MKGGVGAGAPTEEEATCLVPVSADEWREEGSAGPLPAWLLLLRPEPLALALLFHWPALGAGSFAWACWQWEAQTPLRARPVRGGRAAE